MPVRVLKPPGRRGNVEVVCARYGVPLLPSLQALIAELGGALHPTVFLCAQPHPESEASSCCSWATSVSVSAAEFDFTFASSSASPVFAIAHFGCR